MPINNHVAYLCQKQYCSGQNQNLSQNQCSCIGPTKGENEVENERFNPFC